MTEFRAHILGVLSQKRPALTVFAIVWLCLLAASLRVGNSLSSGDDPHYLVATESLIQDGDVHLQNNYAGQGYRAFFPAELQPHVFEGTFLPFHMVGLSVLVAPAYAIGGRTAVLVFLTGLLAILIACFFELLSSRFSRIRALLLTLGLMAAPFVFTSMTVFPELSAALLIFYFFAAFFVVERPGHLVAALIVVGLFPWLHTKYLLVAAVCNAAAVLWLLQEERRAKVAVPPIALGFGVQWSLIGSFFWWNRWVGIPLGRNAGDLKLGHGEGVYGLLLDASFGILPYAPFLILFAPGLVLLWRRDSLGGLTALLLFVAIYYPPATAWFWYGGYSLPGRLILPIVPLMWWVSCEVFFESPRRVLFDVLYAVAGLYAAIVALRSVFMSNQLFLGYPQIEGKTAILTPFLLQSLLPSVTRSNSLDLAATFGWVALAGFLVYLVSDGRATRRISSH